MTRRTLLLLVLLVILGVAWRRPEWILPAGPAEATPAPLAAAPALPARTLAVSRDREARLAAALPPPRAAAGTLSDTDAKLYTDIVTRVNAGAAIVPTDVDTAGELFGRYPDEKPVEQLLVESLLQAATLERRARRDAQAVAYLRRLVAFSKADARGRSALLTLLTSLADWAALESTAQDFVARDPRDADAWYALGYALFRQDRNREARDALRSCLDIREHAQARELLERLTKNQADEAGMVEQQVAHFHVRYDGDSHDDVGREILRALERHYLTLVSALDHQPQTTIPVVLFSSEAYYDASGAPAWSGGVFDNIDGRIRVPIGGLTQSLSADMEGTLIHELTHAFIADKTKGVAPREIHEGIAQYMEGDRIASRLDRQQLAALAAGRIGGVRGFYLSALSFAEYLVDRRGQGGINDLLKAMGETGNVNDAFQQVHGQTLAETQKAWRIRLQQQHGS